MSTHSLLAFAPCGRPAVGGSLKLLHVTREAFLFISACMLTYGDRGLPRHPGGSGVAASLWSRCPTCAGPSSTSSSALRGEPERRGRTYSPLYLFATGYPALLPAGPPGVLRAFRLLLVLAPQAAGHHGLGSRGRPGPVRTGVVHALGRGPGRDAGLLGQPGGPLLPVLSGGRHGRRPASGRAAPLARSDVRLLVAGTWRRPWSPRSGTPWRPTTSLVAGIGLRPLPTGGDPFNIGAIACLYLFGVGLVHPRRSRRTRALIVGLGQRLRDLSGPAAVHHDPGLARVAAPQRGYLPWPVIARDHRGARLRSLHHADGVARRARRWRSS